MAGVLPEKCFDTGSLVRFGYIELEENSEYFSAPGQPASGHMNFITMTVKITA